MRRIVNLVVFGALLYFGYTRALPWLQAKRATEQQATTEVAATTRCLTAAENAAWSVSDEALPFVEGTELPVDRVLWGGVLVRVGSQLAKADNACTCPTDACHTASLATREARRLLHAINGAVQTGDSAGIRDAGSRVAEISALLKQAQNQTH